MSHPLAGLRILVTRPAAQATGLCRAIEGAGGVPLSVPTLEIQATHITPATLRHLMTASDRVIFVSRNAVQISGELLGDLPAVLSGREVCAVGAGTARALSLRSVPDVKHARDQGGSESLLMMPEFAAARVQNRRILIVRGDGGRELLRVALEQRGAHVSYAEVYRRVSPEDSPSRLRTVWEQGKPDIIVITSEQGLDNLLDMARPELSADLLQRQLVVMSARLAGLAADKGFSRPATVATSLSDAGLVQAIIQSVEQTDDRD